MKSFAFPTLAFLLILAPMLASAQDGSFIHIQEIKGRSWLVGANGRPFFAHGVTHIGTSGHGEDVKAIGQACKDLGFNAYGYGCANKLKPQLPYVEGKNHLVPMSLYRLSDGSFSYVDVFDPKEQARLEREIKKVCEANRQSPNLIGYCWTDLGAWPLDNVTGTNWVKFIRELPDDAPGRTAYRSFLTTWKGNDTVARDLAFLRLIAREYFRTLGEANRRFDPDHLIFGDRFTFQTAIPQVIKEMLPYVDAIAIQPRFQPGFPRKDFDRIHTLAGKPILICDFAIRFQDGDKKIRGWKPVESAKVAGERYSAYVRQAMATPYILGTFWCNPIDSKPGFKKAGIKQGLFDHSLTPRPNLNRVIRELNQFLEKQTPK
jgi:hypothetical protein